jgi:hypothetical protein
VVAELFKAEHTRKLLWSHAACQVGTLLTWNGTHVGTPVGQGYGIRRSGKSASVVVHPNNNTPQIGELALTASGLGTQVVPRCGASYVAYLDSVADAVEAIFHSR